MELSTAAENEIRWGLMEYHPVHQRRLVHHSLDYIGLMSHIKSFMVVFSWNLYKI